MKIKPIDSKYGIAMLHNLLKEPPKPSQLIEPEPVIIKISNLEPIPDDEPLFLLRARDKFAVTLLHRYLAMCTSDNCTYFHINGIYNVIDKFIKFKATHPERMKQPGITRGL